MSLLDNKAGNGGVGNYKGVMLCNRPFAGSVAGGAKGNEGSDKNAFSCGIVPQEVGSTVSIANKDKQVRRPKKETAITRHRKWLADLQRTKERLEAEYMEEAERKRESNARFTAKEAKMRQTVREVRHMDDPESEEKEEKGSERKEGGGGGKKGKQRPAWALPSDKKSDPDQDPDEEDLLAFVSGLDYDKYIHDVEVKTMTDRIRARITELEREIAQDEKREKESGQRQQQRAQQENESTYDSEEEEEDSGDETLRAARELLHKRQPGNATDRSDLNFRSVHSAQSAAALVRASKEKDEEGPRVMNEPKIVKYEQTEGSRLENKLDISKLPYMHRNPAL